MLFRNLSDTRILADSLGGNPDADSEFVSCDMDGISLCGLSWNGIEFSSCNANSVSLSGFRMSRSSFVRSSLMRSLFDGGILDGCAFSGTTLIRTQWNAVRIDRSDFFQCAMQRTRMSRCAVRDSRFSDFEGIDASISGCLFLNCRFEVTYGGGMNGFSGAKFTNCIFYGCSFSGYPLRGAYAQSCVFSGCRGEITDDAECHDSAGLGGFCGEARGMPLSNREAALQFISNMESENGK